jgi:tetratricopeptide (TPR) repeat protein
MLTVRAIAAIVVAMGFLSGSAMAESSNLAPKYGEEPKNEARIASDRKFIEEIDKHYQGNRKQAATDIAARGWQFLRQNNSDDAMRRFNQAWLMDNKNGHALWGMATVSAIRGRIPDSLKLFAEAEQFVGDDIDFAVDHAKTLGIAGAQTNDGPMLKDAFGRFAKLHERAPQHTMNLQNWAITLYHVGNYAEAWEKVKLAEATPRGAQVDKAFIAALEAKMRRP